jgi:hypothetical protein
MLAFFGLTFDVASAINIAIGGIIAMIGGLVAAKIQAQAAREAANLAASVQIALAREADIRNRRKSQVDPVLSHAGRLVSGYGTMLRLAKEGRGAEAEMRFRRLLEEVGDFDIASVYVGAGDEFAGMFNAFLEYEAGARARAQQCFGLRREDQRAPCVARDLTIEVFKLTPMLANLHRAANRYIYGDSAESQTAMPQSNAGPAGGDGSMDQERARSRTAAG